MEKCFYCDRNYPILKTGGNGEDICTMCAGVDLDGNIIKTKGTPFVAEYKPGRNDLCFCGSGLKYKKCCINK